MGRPLHHLLVAGCVVAALGSLPGYQGPAEGSATAIAAARAASRAAPADRPSYPLAEHDPAKDRPVRAANGRPGQKCARAGGLGERCQKAARRSARREFDEAFLDMAATARTGDAAVIYGLLADAWAAEGLARAARRGGS